MGSKPDKITEQKKKKEMIKRSGDRRLVSDNLFLTTAAVVNGSINHLFIPIKACPRVHLGLR